MVTNDKLPLSDAAQSHQATGPRAADSVVIVSRYWNTHLWGGPPRTAADPLSLTRRGVTNGWAQIEMNRANGESTRL